MRLRAWVKDAGKGAIARLARQTGISYQTIHALAAAGCTQRARYDNAKRISEATDGAVSIAELCELPRVRAAEADARAAKRKRRRRRARIESLQPAAHG